MVKTQANFEQIRYFTKNERHLSRRKITASDVSMQHLEKLPIGQLMQENLFLVMCRIRSIKWLF